MMSSAFIVPLGSSCPRATSDNSHHKPKNASILQLRFSTRITPNLRSIYKSRFQAGRQTKWPQLPLCVKILEAPRHFRLPSVGGVPEAGQRAPSPGSMGLMFLDGPEITWTMVTKAVEVGVAAGGV